jgi:hypothetical protein
VSEAALVTLLLLIIPITFFASTSILLALLWRLSPCWLVFVGVGHLCLWDQFQAWSWVCCGCYTWQYSNPRPLINKLFLTSALRIATMHRYFCCYFGVLGDYIVELVLAEFHTPNSWKQSHWTSKWYLFANFYYDFPILYTLV